MSGNAYLPARVSRLDDPLGFLGVADSNRFHARLLGGIRRCRRANGAR